jgi:hypothetical protein
LDKKTYNDFAQNETIIVGDVHFFFAIFAGMGSTSLYTTMVPSWGTDVAHWCYTMERLATFGVKP